MMFSVAVCNCEANLTMALMYEAEGTDLDQYFLQNNVHK